MLFEDLKKISKHYVIYAGGTIINKAIGFIMVPVYTRCITPPEYGIIGILNLMVWVLGLIVGMNISAGVTRFYYAYSDQGERGSVVSTAILFVAIFSVPVLASMTLFSGNISYVLFNNKDYSLYVNLSLAALFFEMLLPIPMACFRLKNRSVAFLVFSIAQLFVGLAINIVLIVILRWGILGVLYSQILTPLAISPVLLYFTFKDFGLRFSLDPLKKIISYSLPLIPAGLAMIILNFGDRYILKCFVPMSDVGCYVLGYKIALLLGFFVGLPFNYIWQPYTFSISENENAKNIYAKIFTYYSIFVVFVGLAIAVFAKDIIKLIASPDYSKAAMIMPPVVLGVVFYQLYNLLTLGIMLTKKTRWLACVVSAAAGLNVAMNLALIPRFGTMAAACTTLVSFAFLACLGYATAQKFYRIEYELGRLFKIFFVGIGLYIISSLIQFDNLAVDIFGKSFVVMAYPFALYFFGFYEDKELVKIQVLTKSVKAKFKAISSRILEFAQN